MGFRSLMRDWDVRGCGWALDLDLELGLVLEAV